MNTYTPLTLMGPNESIILLRAPEPSTSSLGHDAPALDVMTDFCRTPMISVPATVQIDDALNKMINSGIRLLFVFDTKSAILGSITSYDIQGEKPVLYLQSRDCRIGVCSRDDIKLQDIMTPMQQWRMLNYDDLPYATLGNIVQTLKELGQRHLIVAETIPSRSAQIVRGLFSASALERALGINIEASETARSFAEIKRKLVR